MGHRLIIKFITSNTLIIRLSWRKPTFIKICDTYVKDEKHLQLK